MIIDSFFLQDENCACAGVANQFGDGAECKLHDDYTNAFLNSTWCYAETTKCTDAIQIEENFFLEYENGTFGPSHDACSNNKGIYQIKSQAMTIEIEMKL